MGLCGGGEARADTTKAKGGGGLGNAAGRAPAPRYHLRKMQKRPIYPASPLRPTPTAKRSLALLPYVPKAFEQKDFAEAKPLGAKSRSTDLGQME